MLTTFRNLEKFQLTEYILLALFAFCIPFSWRIATYVMMALFANVILKGIFEEGFKPNSLQQKHKFIYIIFIAFWTIYAISFLYSENSAEARVQIGKKLSFLLFPLFFLFSNLSYLNKDRIRTIMYCFVFGILALFIVNLVWAGYDVLFRDYSITRITSPHRFFKTDDTILTSMHRAHFSLFTSLGFVFCFVELINAKSKIFNLLALVVLFFSPFYVYSRAGSLCIIIISFILWIWLTFALKKTKFGVISGIIFISLLISGYFAFPKTIERFTNAIENIQKGKGDCRLTIRNANRYVIKENILFGVGSGDRTDETLESYQRHKDSVYSQMIPDDIDNFEIYEQNVQVILDSIHIKYGNKYDDRVYKYIANKESQHNCDYSLLKQYLPEYQTTKHCIKHELNAHNQFSDTIIAVGLIGLLLFISMFISPIYLWIKNKNFDIVFFSLLVIIAFNSLFESVLERQMGIMFFVFFYMLLFHGVFCQQTIDNEQQTLSNNSN